MAAHLGSGVDVPDLDEVVTRPADEALRVWGEIDREHDVRVTRQRARLPPTHLYLRWQSSRMMGVSTTIISKGGPGESQGFMSGLRHQEAVRILSGLAEVLSGLLKPDYRDHHVQLEKS